MDALVQTGNYGDINTTDTDTMGYYVMKFVSGSYTLQEETIYYGKISTDGELFVKYEYINCMQDNTKLYWEQKPQQNSIICYHTQNCASILEFHYRHQSKDIKNICNKNQACKDLPKFLG